MAPRRQAAAEPEVEALLDQLASALQRQEQRERPSGHASMREAGHLEFLVALVGQKQPEARKAKAADSMAWLCLGPEATRHALCEAGAVPPLVALLAAGAASEAARGAAYALGQLAGCSEARSAAIVEAGAVPLLVALLADGSRVGGGR